MVGSQADFVKLLLMAATSYACRPFIVVFLKSLLLELNCGVGIVITISSALETKLRFYTHLTLLPAV